MPFNGSGTFNRLFRWVNDRDGNIKIQAERMDQEMDGIAEALSQCLTRDGQGTPIGTFKMGNQRIVELADPINDTDAVNKRWVLTGNKTWEGVQTYKQKLVVEAGGADITGDSKVGGTFTVTGQFTAQANAKVDSLTVTAAATVGGDLVVNNAAPTIRLQDTDHMTAFLHCNANTFYVLRSAGANGTTFDSGPNGRHPMTLNLASGDVVFSGNMGAFSDERLKKNVRPITGALDVVCAMMGVWFDRIETGEASSGVIAQQIRPFAPELVGTDKDGFLYVNYAQMAGYFIEAIKALRAQIEELRDGR